MGMVRTDAFIRDRRLTRDEVIAINHLLKVRIPAIVTTDSGRS
jgi:hypothetical protein